MTHEDFLKKYLGTFVETRNASNDTLNQCVDLALRYSIDVWGIPLGEIPRGHAISWSHGGHIKKHYGTWVKNTPTAIPSQGSIIVFNISKWGHIAIVDNADIKDVSVIEQNAGGHANLGESLKGKKRASNCVRINKYVNYRHVLGWYEKS